MKIFDTVAQMKLAVLAVGQIVETLGYNSANDGGGAQYITASPQAVDGLGDHELANGNVVLLIKINTTAKQYGAMFDGSTNDQPSCAAQLASENKAVLVEGSTYFGNPLTVSEGQSVEGVGGLQDSIVGGTTIVTDQDISLISLNGRSTSLKGFRVQNTSSSTTAAIECVDNVCYFNNFENIVTEGFRYGLRGQRTLYHTHKNCNYDDCEYGVDYFGNAGTWNTVWFNNAHVFDHCTFRRNSVIGAYIKGVAIKLTQPDAASCPVGIQLEGDSSSVRGYGNVIDAIYCENTNKPFNALFADVTIVGGFVQGFGSPSVGDQVFTLNDSTVEIVGNLTGQDLWNIWADLTNNSKLVMNGDGIFGVSGSLSSKITKDATSILELKDGRVQSITASLSPSSTENLFTPSVDGTFLVSASSPSFSNHYWSGIVQKAGGDAQLRIFEFQSNRTTMNDNSGVLQIQNTDGAQTTAYEWSYVKLSGR